MTDLQQHGDQNNSQIIYRFEEIPRDELNLMEDEMLIPVSHFYKDVFYVFGTPFFVRIKQGEPFTTLKDRIQKKLGVPDKEWEKVSVRFQRGHQNLKLFIFTHLSNIPFQLLILNFFQNSINSH